LKPPATFGATKAPKTFLIDPYKIPAHGRLCRSNRRLTQSPVRFAVKEFEALSFRGGVVRDCSKNPSPPSGSGGMPKGTKSTGANLDGLSGRLHSADFLGRAYPPLGPRWN
jgi:hypothetical protein